jgi:hypothetical protein
VSVVTGVPLVLTVGAVHERVAEPVVAAATVTVALCEAVPPAPVQVNIKVVEAVSAPVAWEPLVASDPDQPPEAAQLVALVDAQLNVEPAPLAILVGLALSDTIGATAETVTVADCAADPPVPAHVIEYVVLVVSAAVVKDPLAPLVPLQPPEAAQLVALVADQLNVAVAPLLTVLGLAENVTAGAAAVTETVEDCVAVPPAPVQVMPKVWLAVSAPVDWEPLTALLPDQPPVAVQAVAWVADQERVELLPLTTELGLAPKVTVGAGLLTVTVADCVALPPAPVQVIP